QRLADPSLGSPGLGAKIHGLYRPAEIGEVVVAVVPLGVLGRVPELGPDLLAGHAEPALAVGAHRVAEPLPAGGPDTGPLRQGPELVEGPISSAASFPGLSLFVREDPAAGFLGLPLPEHRYQSVREAERGLAAFRLEVVLDLEVKPGDAVLPVDVRP